MELSDFIPSDLITCCSLDGYNELYLLYSKLTIPWHFIISLFYCIWFLKWKLRWYGAPPFCDVLPFEIKNKI